MRKLWIVALALALLLAGGLGARAQENWSLSYQGKPIPAESLDLAAGGGYFRAPSAKEVTLDFRAEEAHHRFFFSFLALPHRLEVYALPQNGEPRLLKSLQPSQEMFQLDVPPHAEKELRFVCHYEGKQRCQLDGFAPVPSEAIALYPHGEPAAQATGLVVLAAAELDDQRLEQLRGVVKACPDMGVAVLEKADAVKRHQLTFRLWQGGIPCHPQFAQLPKTKAQKLNEAQQLKLWGQEKLDAFLCSVIRAWKPLYLFTPKGEDGAAKALAAAAIRAQALSASSRWEREAAAQQGLWHVPCLAQYPLDAALPTLSREEAREKTTEVLLEAIRKRWASTFAEPSALGVEHGFATDGEEQVLADPNNGVWAYRSQSLSVLVVRHVGTEATRVWYEADIRVNLQTEERLQIIGMDQGRESRRMVKPWVLARANQSVFSMNTDYYAYRASYKMSTGVIIRKGQILFSGEENAKKRVFPSLDNLALFPDGSMKAFAAKEHTAQEFLEMGAAEVLSFGPLLTRNGELCFSFFPYSQAKEPRCGLGMVEKGHYLAIMVEGRLERSEGCGLQDLADLFYARGCQEAINLDGGGTAVMLFMGGQITSVGGHSGGRTLPRSMNELISVGTSAQVSPSPAP